VHNSTERPSADARSSPRLGDENDIALNDLAGVAVRASAPTLVTHSSSPHHVPHHDLACSEPLREPEVVPPGRFVQHLHEPVPAVSCWFLPPLR
jgi:hypothetical protein